MKSIRELDPLIGLIVKHNLPKEQNLFMNEQDYKELCDYFNYLGSSGVGSTTLKESNPPLEIDTIHYGGIKFNIIHY